jgi:glycosyltransferase involved in cell wall biosynthesis
VDVSPKIVRIAYVFYDAPGSTAGPRINALRILPEFVKRGWEVHAIIGFHGACAAEVPLRDTGVISHPIRWPFFCERQMSLLKQVVLQIDPDVFVPNISASGCYVARFLREAGRPTIAGHLSDDTYNWGMAERFCRVGDEFAVSALFCMGCQLGDVVRGWNPPRTRVVDICHGVPMSDTPPNLVGPLRLVYAGRLEQKQKRILDVVRAFSRILGRYLDAEAVIIGDGPDLADVRAMVRSSGFGSRFRLAGYTPPESVQREMQWGNSLVLLSDYEGVPAAVMDGMAAGLVPVCLDIPGGLRELVIHEQTGLLVSDREGDFDLAIDRLAQDFSLRRRLSSAARAHVEKSFSLQSSVDAWESLIVGLVSDVEKKKKIEFPREPWLPPRFAAFGDQDVRMDLSGLSRRLKLFTDYQIRSASKSMKSAALHVLSSK